MNNLKIQYVQKLHILPLMAKITKHNSTTLMQSYLLAVGLTASRPSISVFGFSTLMRTKHSELLKSHPTRGAWIETLIAVAWSNFI